MFNIPVISHNARLASGSSGMMHLNALNGSSWWRPSDDNNTLTSSLPTYEEAINNGPSFGLFNVNGGETTTHLHQTQHHHCHNQQNNNHLHFPQSHHRPNNRSGRPSHSVSSHSVSSHDQNGSDNNKTSSSLGEVPLQSCDDNTADRLDRQEPQCERFSRISIVSSSSGNSAPSVPKSPRLDPRTAENKHVVKSEGKGGSGSAGRRKHLTVERSPLTSAKDRLYRVFSPMLSRKNDRSTEQSSKGSHAKAPLSPKARDESSEANEETSHPVRVRIASGRGGSARADRTDDVRSSGGGGGKQHNVKSHHHRHTNAK